MITQRELDLVFLANMVPNLKKDQLFDVLVAKAIQVIGEEIYGLTKLGLFKPYVDEKGQVMVIGQYGEPRALSDLVVEVLQDTSISVFADGPSVDEMTDEEIKELIDANTEGFEKEILH